jgi:hypothetical protein
MTYTFGNRLIVFGILALFLRIGATKGERALR